MAKPLELSEVVELSQSLVEYAGAQYEWAKSGELGSNAWKAEKRGRKAAAAAKALRAFLRTSEQGAAELAEALGIPF